jgi:hypothetical protein
MMRTIGAGHSGKMPGKGGRLPVLWSMTQANSRMAAEERVMK